MGEGPCSEFHFSDFLNITDGRWLEMGSMEVWTISPVFWDGLDYCSRANARGFVGWRKSSHPWSGLSLPKTAWVGVVDLGGPVPRGRSRWISAALLDLEQKQSGVVPNRTTN